MTEVKFEDHILLWSFDEFKKIYGGLGNRLTALFGKQFNEERLNEMYKILKDNYDYHKTYFNGLNSQKRCNVEYEDNYTKRIILSADRTDTLQIVGSTNYKKVKDEKKTLIPVAQNENEFNLILDYFLQEKIPSEGELIIDYKFKSIINLGTEGKFNFTKNPKKMDGGIYDDDGLYFGEPGKVYFRRINYFNRPDKTYNELLHALFGHNCNINRRKNIGLNGTLSIDDKLIFAGTFDSDGWWPFILLNKPKPETKTKIKKSSEYKDINPKDFSIADYKNA